MEELFSTLEEITECLEQIHSITQNQMTILLETKYMGEGLDMIEQMATYKENLTTEVEEREQVFQGLYSAYRDKITEVEDKKKLKKYVDHIMKLKELIIEGEQKNVMVMQDLLRRCAERVEIPKNAQRVAEAYKAQGKNK